jgi:hypothetical protein
MLPGLLGRETSLLVAVQHFRDQILRLGRDPRPHRAFKRRKLPIPENASGCVVMAFMMAASFGPLNGGVPESKIYKITPKLHTSHFDEYCPLSTSGAM